MSSFGFSLADRLGAKTYKCTVRGCSRSFTAMVGKGGALGGRAAPDPADPLSGMCDPCREKAPQLADKQEPCSRQGCERSWTWPKDQQLEAFAQKRQAPRRLCSQCESELSALSDREVPCSVPGCKRTGTWSKRAQLASGGAQAPEDVMCDPCAGVAKSIKDMKTRCAARGCKNQWTWPVHDQLVAFAAGLPYEPPRKFCTSCQASFGDLAERTIKCRTSGCKKTWTWTVKDQMNAVEFGKPLPKAPSRMCDDCHKTFIGLEDVERPCRRSGCKNTWTDKRGAQLARAVRGKTGDPYPRYCEKCEKEVGELEDRQVKCKTDGCEGTWTWSAQQQLAAGVRPHIRLDEAPAHDAGVAAAHAGASGTAPEGRATPGADGPANETPVHDAGIAAAQGGAAAPAVEVVVTPAGGKRDKRNRRERKRGKQREVQAPHRHCESCAEFLTTHKTQEIACTRCQTPIFWPPESQLQQHLGNWAAPTLCGACKRDVIEAARAAEREYLRQHPQLPGAEPAAPEAETAATPAPDDDGAPETPATD